MKPTRKDIALTISIIGAIAAGAIVVLERHALHLVQETVALVGLGLLELVSISTVLYEAAKEQERFLSKSNVKRAASLWSTITGSTITYLAYG